MIPLAITNRKIYERIEEDVISYLGELAIQDEKFLASIKKFPAAEKLAAIKARRSEKEYKSSRAIALVKINALKMAAVVGKLKAAKEWIHNFLESGQKLVVFAHHVKILDELIDEFPHAVHTRDGDRATAEERFQTDPKANLFIGSLKRDGVGITLTASSATVFLELGWNPATHDQAEDRVHRIGQKDAVTAYYLLANRTIDEMIAALIERKRQMVNAVADGDPLKGSEIGSIEGAVLTAFTKKALLTNSKMMEEREPVTKFVFPKKKKGKKVAVKKAAKPVSKPPSKKDKHANVKKVIKKYAVKAKAKKATKKAKGHVPWS